MSVCRYCERMDPYAAAFQSGKMGDAFWAFCFKIRRWLGPWVRVRRDDKDPYSAACCVTVGSVPATVARRMSRGCDWS